MVAPESSSLTVVLSKAELNNLVKVIVYNRTSREPLVEFFKSVLKCNVKRSNMQVGSRSGFRKQPGVTGFGRNLDR